MAERADALTAFLADAGWHDAAREPMGGDASARRYERLSGRARTGVLMDAPPPEDVRPFVHVAGVLRGLGFSAPAIEHADPENGFLVLEDFGTRTMAAALADGTPAEPLYRLATDTLIALHRCGVPGEAAVPSYSVDRYLDEARLLTDWFCPAVGVSLSRADVAAYEGAWREALANADLSPRTLVLRDYFPDNLMLLERPGVRACGLLDFQDAVTGPGAYDLASLLQDARRDVSPAIEQAMLARYLNAFPETDAAAFRTAYAVLAAQRHAKVIGIFTRLAYRDGKPDYLRHIPRVWHHLESCLTAPALAPVARWLDARVPPGARRQPEESPA
ncbi:hypothetical protein SAMN05216241_11133 [Limimonas halophila]|uniref:Aminoglycoside phosphotransferase domain-containing protein n=1 Tax=Limimonas halophila TaxID=1082479 RepID=A0A1G7U157_9PROT|nr:phosphotransferase [Limimonas halophila]SDG41148.1 hypothetical protein SAMN05216241_11133 [Limimonas halophila]